ncbi:MAG: tripartite tricarboxylate transporter substrate binding protein [Rubrivivax sp.]|nr:tripartite tricarboxylate transporter substrate binding protein [Rubrivivax sp.]
MQLVKTVGRLGAAVLALFAAVAATPALAAYPEAQIKIIVGFPPGGGGDTYGRLIAEHMGRSMGKTIVVDNKPGAGGNLAADAVAKAKPDGYTLLFAMSGNVALAPVLRGDKLPYKSPDDFVMIGTAVEAPHGLFVAASSKFQTAQQFFEAARGGKLSFASSGMGGSAHITMEMVVQAAKVNMLHVPYRGTGPAITDLIGGQVDSFFATAPPVMGQVKGGRVRLLAISGESRNPSMPGIPTLKEIGIPVVLTQWYGLAAPAGTPPEVVDFLSHHLSQALASKEFQQTVRMDGAVEVDRPKEKFRQFLLEDIATYRRGLTPELLKTVAP